MESKIKFLGHPVHPILIVFPLGLLAAAVLFDVVYLISESPKWETIAYWTMGAGILGALVAAPFGLIDWLSVPKNTRARKVGGYHGIVSLHVVGLFLVSWLIRGNDYTLPSVGAYVFSFLGFVLMGVTGWLGGELVNRLGVSVEEGANVNAPSSLSETPVLKTKNRTTDVAA